ncbi:hypothetical protein [Streptomyces xanthochromogenes]
MDHEAALQIAEQYLLNSAYSRPGDIIFRARVEEIDGWLVADWGHPDETFDQPEKNVGYNPVIVNLQTGETRLADVSDVFLW